MAFLVSQGIQLHKQQIFCTPYYQCVASLRAHQIFLSKFLVKFFTLHKLENSTFGLEIMKQYSEIL
jgi:hypothetical protein